MLDDLQFPYTTFWEYSLEIYGKKNIPKACLNLQENLAADVNILLFCCWSATSGYSSISNQVMVEISSQVQEFHEQVVKNLRVARTLLKSGHAPLPDKLCEALYKNILSIEIDCEHGEQVMLARLANKHLVKSRGDPDIETGAENLKSYLNNLDAIPTAKDLNNLAFILSTGVTGGGRKIALSLLSP